MKRYTDKIKDVAMRPLAKKVQLYRSPDYEKPKKKPNRLLKFIKGRMYGTEERPLTLNSMVTNFPDWVKRYKKDEKN